MAHADEVRVSVRQAYVQGLGLEVAASRANVPHATAKRWKAAAREAGDDWDKLRVANLQAAGGGVEEVLRRVLSAGIAQCEATYELIEHADIDLLDKVRAQASLADSLTKMQRAITRLMPEMAEIKQEIAELEHQAKNSGKLDSETLRRVREEIYGIVGK